METKRNPMIIYLHPDGKYKLKRYALAGRANARGDLGHRVEAEEADGGHLHTVAAGKPARALNLTQGRPEELRSPFCSTPVSYTLCFPYALADALAVQECEPTGKARAEIAEIWGG